MSDTVNLVIGVLVSLCASIMDALGLNLLKLDHVRESKKDTRQQRTDCGRPLWHVGLYTYIASQLIGSTIALSTYTSTLSFYYRVPDNSHVPDRYYLKTQWVAPLGSFALIVNFVLARVMVGTTITRKDVMGTFVIILSVLAIVIFGGMFNGPDPEDNITLDSLKVLFVRPVFIIYFSVLNVITFAGLFFGLYTRWVMAKEERKLKSRIYRRVKPKTLKKIAGLLFSLDGGMLASETLLLAKSGRLAHLTAFTNILFMSSSVKLFTLSISSQVNQFTDNTSRFILLALMVTAVLQVYCLNTGLKLSSSVIVVPIFYATYTALGLVNTMVYLDELGSYPGWVLALVFLGIAVLIYGVYLLSSKEDPQSSETDTSTVYTDDQELSDLSETVSTPPKRQSTIDGKSSRHSMTDDPERCYSESSATNIPIGIHIEPISRQTTSAESALNQPILMSGRSWRRRDLFGWKNAVLLKVWPRKSKSSTEIHSLTRADTNQTLETSSTLTKPAQAQYGDLSRDISAYHDTNLSIVHTSEDVRRRYTGISASNSDTDIQLTIHSSSDLHNASKA
ncbi:hypothetical protein INT44_004782 [Umbelopsis vinacea]|uniref:Magnesium transporter n=1 Tax=Umbelopsis vinacea TaxID=44442 RepID=A0A8H7Q6Y8_9FUNG|nr:hypothetical protein INT44_004782 [Umbelopsis vinacea]